MTAAATRYRETLIQLMLLRVGGCTEKDEDPLLDALDEHWEQMTPSERANANQYAADLAQGRIPVTSVRQETANQIQSALAAMIKVGSPSVAATIWSTLTRRRDTGEWATITGRWSTVRPRGPMTFTGTGSVTFDHVWMYVSQGTVWRLDTSPTLTEGASQKYMPEIAKAARAD
jgi:hypothetical protein